MPVFQSVLILLGISIAAAMLWLVLGAASGLAPALGPRFWANTRVAIGAALTMLGLVIATTSVSPLRFPLSIGLLLSGGVFGFQGYRQRQRHPANAKGIRWGSEGLGGLLLFALGGIGYFFFKEDMSALGGTLMGISAASFLVLMAYEMRQASKIKRVLRFRMQGVAPPSSNAQGLLSEWDDDRLKGSWSGAVTTIDVEIDGIRAEVALEHWPAGLELHPGVSQAKPTGDPVFDQRWSITDLSESWRLVLQPKIREILTELADGPHGVVLRDGKLFLTIEADQVDETPHWLDLAASLSGSRLPPQDVDWNEALLTACKAEHLATVRTGHYQHLVSQQWEVPRVMRQAATDDDILISAWAKDQLPPEAGVFR